MSICDKCNHRNVCGYQDDTTLSCSQFQKEVVQCKDCKYKFEVNGHSKKGCPLDGMGLMNENDFCSCGERKEKE